MQTQRFTSFLQFMPMSLFGAVMGLCGLSFAWTLAASIYPSLKNISELIGITAVAAFLLLNVLYLIKWNRFPQLAKAEFNNAVSVSFFGTYIISLLLLPGILLRWNEKLAVVVWAAGTVLMLLFALYVLRFWLAKPKQPESIHPAWIIPIVGTLDVPIIGMHLPVEGIREISTFFFAIGILFTVILLTVVLTRLMINPLPVEQQAAVLILIGPLALAFADLESLTGAGMLSSVIFYADLFLLLLLGSKLVKLPFCCPFRLGWWAVSFPLTAITGASYRFSLTHPGQVFKGIWWILLTVTTVVILFLLMQTLYRYFNNSFLESASQAPKKVNDSASIAIK